MLLISPNFAVKSIIFPNFGQEPFPKIAGKSPESRKQCVSCLQDPDDLDIYCFQNSIQMFR